MIWRVGKGKGDRIIRVKPIGKEQVKLKSLSVLCLDSWTEIQSRVIHRIYRLSLKNLLEILTKLATCYSLQGAVEHSVGWLSMQLMGSPLPTKAQEEKQIGEGTAPSPCRWQLPSGQNTLSLLPSTLNSSLSNG